MNTLTGPTLSTITHNLTRLMGLWENAIKVSKLIMIQETYQN